MDIVEKVIYCFWTGDNQMSANRRAALDTMFKNIDVKIEFLDQCSIE